MIVTRAEVAERIAAWRDERIGPAELAAWAGQFWTRVGVEFADAQAGASLTREVLVELDQLGVSLLTTDDAALLLELLATAAGEQREAIVRLGAHVRGIDLDERSRRLRRSVFYRPFCR